jgi:hypothetical protein
LRFSGCANIHGYGLAGYQVSSPSGMRDQVHRKWRRQNLLAEEGSATPETARR